MAGIKGISGRKKSSLTDEEIRKALTYFCCHKWNIKPIALALGCSPQTIVVTLGLRTGFSLKMHHYTDLINTSELREKARSVVKERYGIEV